MAVQVPQGFIVTSMEPIDSRLVLTKEQMVAYSSRINLMPPVYLSLCPQPSSVTSEGNVYKLYIYNRNNPDIGFRPEIDAFGRFRPYAGSYDDLVNKPEINGVPVLGRKDGKDYSLQDLLIASEGISLVSTGNHSTIIKVKIDDGHIHFNSEAELFVEFDSEFSYITSEFNALWDAIDSEAAIRQAEDERLEDLIDSECAARALADSELWDALDSEAYIRALADSELWFALGSEIDERKLKDSEFEAALDSEEYFRKLADSEIWEYFTSEIARLDSEKQDVLTAIFPLEITSEDTLVLHFDPETLEVNSDFGLMVNFDSETLVINNSELSVRRPIPFFESEGNVSKALRVRKVNSEYEIYWEEVSDLDDLGVKLYYLDSEYTLASSHNQNEVPLSPIYYNTDNRTVYLDLSKKEDLIGSGVLLALDGTSETHLPGEAGYAGLLNPEDVYQNLLATAPDDTLLFITKRERDRLTLRPVTRRQLAWMSSEADSPILRYGSGHPSEGLPVPAGVLYGGQIGNWSPAEGLHKVAWSGNYLDLSNGVELEKVDKQGAAWVASEGAPIFIRNLTGADKNIWQLGIKYDNETIQLNSEGQLVSFGIAVPTPIQDGKALIGTSENTLIWGEAGKVDALRVSDALGHTKKLEPVNKVITVNVDKGLQITSEGTIIHINEVDPQTRLANHILTPVGTDAQGHIIDGTTGTVANGLRELTFYDRTNNAGAYVLTSQPWAIVADPTNITNTTNVALKIAGFDGNKSAGHKYDNATLKIDATGLSANYKANSEQLFGLHGSEELIEINGNVIGLHQDFLNRIQSTDFRKSHIDSEGLNDSEDRYYPTIQLLDTELNAKQDLLSYRKPAYITSEGDVGGPNVLKVLYDNRTIVINNSESALKARDVDLVVNGYLSNLIPYVASEGNKLVDFDSLYDAVSGNLGRFQGNYDSEADLPTPAQRPGLQKNDYAFITEGVQTSEGIQYYYLRYKYVNDSEGTTGHWEFEYRVSGSTYTSAQLAALNSMWSSVLTNRTIEHLGDTTIHITSEERTLWTDKQPKLSLDTNSHLNSTSFGANKLKVDVETTIPTTTAKDGEIPTIGAVKNYFKVKQTPVNDAALSSEGAYFISSITQDAQGVITPKKYAYTYNTIPNKPTINNVELIGNKYTEDLIQAKNGIKIDTDHKISHTNAITAETSEGIYPIKFDAQGHITYKGTKFDPATKENKLPTKVAGKFLKATSEGYVWADTPEELPKPYRNGRYLHVTSEGGLEWGVVSGGGGGTSDYDGLSNRPSINGTTITGNMTGKQFVTAGTGLTFAADNKTLNHSNVVTANTTSGIKYFTYDAQGHVTTAANKTLGRGIDDQSNIIGHSNTAITPDTTQKLRITAVDAYGHVTGQTVKTLSRGIDDQSNVIGHSNAAVTPQTTANLAAITYDNYGHITAGTSKTVGRGIDDQSNVIGHSNTAITAGTHKGTQNIGGDSEKAGGYTTMPKFTYDTYGHITAVTDPDTAFEIYPPITAGTDYQVWRSIGNKRGKWQDTKILKIFGEDPSGANGIYEEYRPMYISNGATITTFTVWPTVGTNFGTIAPYVASTHTEGSAVSITFTATPATGYKVKDWFVNGVARSVTSDTFTLTTSAIDRDYVVEVKFMPEDQTVYVLDNRIELINGSPMNDYPDPDDNKYDSWRATYKDQEGAQFWPKVYNEEITQIKVEFDGTVYTINRAETTGDAQDWYFGDNEIYYDNDDSYSIESWGTLPFFIWFTSNIPTFDTDGDGIDEYISVITNPAVVDKYYYHSIKIYV